MRNEVFYSVKQKSDILHTVKRMANWIGHILRSHCALKTRYLRKAGGRDRSEGKTKKKTLEFTG
jgi:hypothetical protein